MGLISRVSSRTYRVVNHITMRASLQRLAGTTWDTIPKAYKPKSSSWIVKGTPYEIIERDLARQGLKYPWLRNEMWSLNRHKNSRNLFRNNVTKFWPAGFAAFVVHEILTTSYYTVTGKPNPHVNPTAYMMPIAIIPTEF